MKSILVLLFNIIITTSIAQTKVIAFKSHSGNMKNFCSAMEHAPFNNETSNFWLPPTVTTYHLDSVIYISPSVTILVQKLYKRSYIDPKDSAKFVRIVKDTLHNDPLFSRSHSLDSIKAVLNTRKEYDNSVKKAVFIGYDNKKTQVSKKKNDDVDTKEKMKENSILPVGANNNNTVDNNPFDTKMMQALAMIFLLALLGGWLSWKIANKKEKPVLDKLAVT